MKSFALPVLVLLGVTAPWISDAVPSEPDEPVDAREVRPAGVEGPGDAVRDDALRPVRAGATASGRWAPEHAAFRLTVGGEPVLHRVMAVVVLPGRDVSVEVGDADGYAFRHQAGRAVPTTGGWRWTAPSEPGVYAARIEGPAGVVDLNLLVAHPASGVRDGALNGYRIGAYRQQPLRGDPAYLPPDGFVEVGLADRDVLVSPHFTLGQFLCKQPGEPRYVSYSAPLVRKLEAVLGAVNEAGIAAPTLHVMSGFRTPAYNRAIGNTTSYSRHLWGDAADVFVDADGNGDMDDLNGDGRSDLSDASVLARLVERVEAGGGDGIAPGGMGTYRRNSAHGPFVHVDARGYRARW